MSVSASSFFAKLIALAPGAVYLVGGPVRDIHLGIESIRDIDLVMPSGSENVARAFADAIGGSFFFLDEERKISRVIRHDGGGTIQFDFTNFEGPDLQADLRRRDFTINAMALDLREFEATGSLDRTVDPFGGREDLRHRLVRAVDPQVLDQDPLRLLRAVRFAAMLGFSIEERTAAEVSARSAMVTSPAPERVRDELFLILSVPGAGRHLLQLDALGLLIPLLPELAPLKGFAPGKHHRYDLFTHSVRTAEYVDGVADDLSDVSSTHAGTVRNHLDEELEQGITRRAALRFACLLHDNAKSETYSKGDDGNIHFYGHDTLGADKALFICHRFRLAGESASTVARLVRHHMRPLNLAAPGGPSRRALYRYCRDLRGAVPESIILSLADARATSEVMPAEGFTDTRTTAGVILDYYYGRFLKTEERPFVNGRDLIARGMAPGPRFRDILEDIRERQAEGSLRDRSEALQYLDTLR